MGKSEAGLPEEGDTKTASRGMYRIWLGRDKGRARQDKR